jgi:hypothetical protein
VRSSNLINLYRLIGRWHIFANATWQELFAEADTQFGGKQAAGVYTPKDAYDAVELAINRYIIQRFPANPTMQGQLFAKAGIANLESVLALTPTQTKPPRNGRVPAILYPAALFFCGELGGESQEGRRVP